MTEGPHVYDPEHCPECQLLEERYPIEAPQRRVPLKLALTTTNPFVAANVRPVGVQHERPATLPADANRHR